MEFESAPIVSSKPSIKPFRFTGKSSEFFGIWIVNLVLTILTLGIYSAWAKVRTHQYFYGNTHLDGASFQYLATPIQILKGRSIAAILFIAYYALNSVYPIWGLGLAGLILLFIPALIVLSMSFRMRHTAYRNVTFGFKRDFKRSYLIYGLPVLAIFASMFSAIFAEIPEEGESLDIESIETPFIFGLIPIVAVLLFPFWEFLKTRFLVSNTRYGASFFDFKAKSGQFYSVYLQALFAFIAVIIIISAAVVIGSSLSADNPDASSETLFAILPMLLFIPMYLWLFAFIQVKRTNLIYSAATLESAKLNSELKVGYMFYLYVTNTIGILISLGLLIPWSMIRTARYRAETMTLSVDTDLDQFIAKQEESMSSFGEEFGEVFDIEVGI